MMVDVHSVRTTRRRRAAGQLFLQLLSEGVVVVDGSHQLDTQLTDLLQQQTKVQLVQPASYCWLLCKQHNNLTFINNLLMS